MIRERPGPHTDICKALNQVRIIGCFVHERGKTGMIGRIVLLDNFLSPTNPIEVEYGGKI